MKRIKKRTLLLPVFLWLGACSNVPTIPNIVPQLRIPNVGFNPLPNGKEVQQANAFLKVGKKRDAASAYFSASKKYRSPERERLMLQAAELAASFNDIDLTQRYLAPVNYSSLNTENQARYRFTQALLAKNDRNYQEVLRILPQRVNGLPIALAQKILRTRMESAKASQNKLALVQELVLQEATLSEEYQIKLNNDRIWNHVLLMPRQELDSARKTMKHPVIKGWLELGYLVKGFKGSGSVSPIFRIKLKDWQKHYPTHPGNRKVEQLLNYKPAAKVTPYLGGVKPSK